MFANDILSLLVNIFTSRLVLSFPKRNLWSYARVMVITYERYVGSTDGFLYETNFWRKKKSKMRDDSAYGTIEPSTGDKKQLNPTQEWKQDKLE